jgi:hypothetical protein
MGALGVLILLGVSIKHYTQTNRNNNSRENVIGVDITALENKLGS